MGFYSPQSLAADARRHGLEVLRPDVQASDVLACVERLGRRRRVASRSWCRRRAAPARTVPAGVRTGDGARSLAVRLGLSSVRSVGEDVAQRVVDERRAHGPFTDLRQLVRRVQLSHRAQLEALATAGALDSLGRHPSRGAVGGRGARAGGTGHPARRLVGVQPPMLPGLGRRRDRDRGRVGDGGLVDSYPTQFVRDGLDAAGVLRVEQAYRHEIGRRVAVAGVVTHRQRPGTAGGITFLSLEDETGLLNVICSAGLWQKFRKVARTSRALVVRGRLERSDGATNLVAEHLTPDVAEGQVGVAGLPVRLRTA